METLVLQRYGSTPMGTFGEMVVGAIKLFTVEQPWNNNTPFHSCIPAGKYRLIPHISPNRGFTWCMVNHELGVSELKENGMQRYACLIHKANYALQLQGCIAPGMKLSTFRKEWDNKKLIRSDQWAVLNSGDAMELLMEALPKNEVHQLIIQWQEH